MAEFDRLSEHIAWIDCRLWSEIELHAGRLKWGFAVTWPIYHYVR